MLLLCIDEEKIPVIFGNNEALKNSTEKKGLKPIIINPATALPIFFTSPDLAAKHDIKYEETESNARVVELTPQVTTYHGARVQKLHTETLGILRLALPDVVWPIAAAKSRSYTLQHLLGLIDLTLKLADISTHKELCIVWKYPEAGLHPAHQTGLGDIVIQIQKYLKKES